MSEPRYSLSADGVYVYDSWDCYREVVRPRRRAATICARFNREHDEWMARGCLA